MSKEEGSKAGNKIKSAHFKKKRHTVAYETENQSDSPEEDMSAIVNTV